MIVTYLQDVPSLRAPSSSSEPCRLALRDWFLELVLDPARDESRELSLDCALRETVFLLSSACLRRSCILFGAFCILSLATYRVLDQTRSNLVSRWIYIAPAAGYTNYPALCLGALSVSFISRRCVV